MFPKTHFTRSYFPENYFPSNVGFFTLTDTINLDSKFEKNINLNSSLVKTILVDSLIDLEEL